MEPLFQLLVIILLAGLLSIIAEYLGLLTFDGAAASLAIGLIIGLFGSVNWLLVLIMFTGLGFAATMVGLARKRAKGLQEGLYGERMYKNVVAVGFVPCVLAVLCSFMGGEDGDYYRMMSIAYIASIAVAAADTVASEVGVKDKRVWMITTFKRVEPGVDGGVSVMGTGVAVAASFITTAIGWILIFGREFDLFLFLIPALAGVAGCLADSVVGATLETKGYVSKYTNNAMTALFGALLAFAVYMFFF